MPKKTPHNQPHFRVGDAMVYPDRLIISINDEEHAIEPRIMEVLIALAGAAQNNEVLSAVNLYIRAWIGRAHAEDNAADPHIDVMQAENPVHKAITHLRKVFGDDPKSPRYIETIRKRGYRLVARVVYQDHYRRVAVARKIWTTGSPYVGLNAFDSRHASVFLGRSRTTGELIEAVRRQIDQQRRLVLVVGASGCGKTSLVNAGAIPILTEKGGYDGLRALSVARCDLAGTRREDALPRLAAALLQWTLDRREILPPQPVETLAGTLRGQPESLSDTLEDAFRRHASRDMSALSHPHLLLVIDHAEAIVADPSFGSDDHAEIDRFLHHLCESRHVCVIVIVRGDFYLALAEALPGMTERKSGDGHVDVLAPRTGEIGDIIRIPAASAGLEFQQHPESKDYLDDVLLRAAVAQPDALPLLQHTLQMLYERRNAGMQLCFDAYQEIGGLEGALAHHAEHVFTGLPGEIQTSLDQVLSRMVVMQPENDRVSARRIPRSMLDAPAIALAEAFVQARLFVAEHENGDAHYRVAHEALLRQWPRAVEWIRENRRMLMARIRLQRAAARWVEEGRRDDHLLNAGRPLEEGLELVERFRPSNMGETHEHTFVRKSNDLCNRRKRIKRAAISALVLLTAFSTASAFFAIKSREEAKNRNEEAQRLANFMLGDVAEELRNLGKLEMLHRISSEAVDYLNNREPDKLSASELSNMARAFRSIGESELEHGDKKSAASAFSRARMTAGIALSKDPRSESALFERGNAFYWIGHHHYTERDYEKAEINWREYLEDAKHLSSIDPENSKWKHEHSYALNSLGSLFLRTGKNREAINLFKESLRLKNDALSMQPDDVDIQYDIIDSASWISSAEESIGNLHGAIAGYESQVEDLKSLIAGNAERATWNLRLANFLMLASSVNIDLGRMEEASRQSAESVKILTALSNSENKNTTWSRDLILAHELSARISRIDSDKNSQARHLASASRIIESMNIDDSKPPTLRLLRISIEIQKIRLEGYIRINEIDALSEDFAKIASRHHEDRMRTSSAEIFIANSIQHMESGNEPDSINSATKALQMLEKCKSREDVKWMALWALASRLSNSGADISTALARLQSTGYRNQELMRLLLDQTDTGRMRP